MPSKTPPKSTADYNGYDLQVIRAQIVELWCNDTMSHQEIADRVNRRLGTDIQAGTVKDAVEHARKHKWLQMRPLRDESLEIQIARRLGSRNHDRKIHVVNSTLPEHVGEAIARHIGERLMSDTDSLVAKPEIHLGFFGGRTTSLAARCLVEFLRRTDHRPSRKREGTTGDPTLVLHSLIGVLDSGEPDTNPNAFLNYFEKYREAIEGHLGRKLRFQMLPMPGAVTEQTFRTLREDSDDVRYRFASRPCYDMVVASCGHANCRYTLTNYMGAGQDHNEELMAKVEAMKAYFRDHDVLGDVAWHPVLSNGMAVEWDDLPLRVATLVTLADMRAMASPHTGTQVLLGVGPCSDPACPYSSKRDLLDWVLRQDPIPAHHIFTDWRTASEYAQSPYTEP